MRLRGKSCVSGMASAVQALEMGLPEDTVDLVVGDQAYRPSQLRGVGRAERAAGSWGPGASSEGVHSTLTAAAAPHWTADAAALTVG